MPRIARVIVPGVPHHVTQRGNRGEAVFYSDADRQVYLDLLAAYAARHELAIHAYCLMADHVHLVAVPATESSLAGCLGPVHLRYAQHVNQVQGLTGRVWQGRFHSAPLDDAHHAEAVRYVELNPVRAGLVTEPEAYPWSSAAAHVTGRADPLLAECTPLREAVGDWRAWLREPIDEERLSTVRRGTRTGRPAGDAAFMARVERLLGRRLRVRRPGRPRKVEP